VNKGRTVPVLVALALVVLTACSGGGQKRTAASRPPSSTTSTTAAPAPANVFPLTGLPASDAARAARPALTVKIENEALARPQSGLQAADLVYEEFIEGGDTRFVAVFQSTDADPVGSIRSVRPTDPLIVRPLGGLFAYSGGTAKFVNLIHAAGVVDVGISAFPAGYFQRAQKPSDHRLFSSTTRLYSAPGAAQAKAPGQVLSFLGPNQAFAPAGAAPASHLDVVVSNQRIAYDWDGSSWKRSINGAPHMVEGAGQLAPTDVIVQFVPWVVSPGDFDTLHSPVYVAQLVGSGDAWILAGGKVVKGHWSKPNPDAPIGYTGPNGEAIRLVPGHTWVELANVGAPAAVR
jgi:hypothetical protein